MKLSDYYRKVQSLFGDEYEFLVTVQDLVDWLNDGMIEIVRETGCLNAVVTMPASELLPITDLFLVKRVQYGTRNLVFTSLSEIDDLSSINMIGTPNSYYLQGASIVLHPSPPVGDTTSVSILYSPAPPAYTEASPPETVIGIPITYHEDLVLYALARAHEKNENNQLSNKKMEEFNGRVTQRRYEAQHGNQEPAYKRIDPLDFDWQEAVY